MNQTIQNKKCKDCGITKPLVDFSKNGKYLASYCKPCQNLRVSRWRSAHPKQAQEYHRKWLLKKFGTTNVRKIPKYAENARLRDKEYHRRYRASSPGLKASEYRLYKARFPEKVAAQQALNRAVKRGEIKKQPCYKCGDSTRPIAHHPDYSQPLVVIWVCSLHHQELHKI